MSDSVQMPALGESVTEGTVTRWLKQVGERVEVDEPLLEVSTDKVDTEIPSPFAGVLEKILVGEDETVDVGTDLAVIGTGDAAGSGPEPQSAPQPEQEQGQSQPQAPAAEAAPAEAPSTDTTEPAAAPQAPVAGGEEGSRVQMPALGESVTEGTVTRWLKAEGDSVEVDEPLLEVSTDKVDTEIPSPVAGVIQKILVGEDETVAVGTALALIGDGSANGQSAEPARSEPARTEPSADRLQAESTVSAPEV